MFMYANLPNGWTELPDDTLINNIPIRDFADILLANKISNSFIEIKLPSNELYLIHISQIQLSKRF